MPHPLSRVPALLLIACLAPAACGSDREWAGTVRDSAGVPIVENPSEPLLPERDRPAVGEPALLLESDRQIMDAAFGPDGHILALTTEPRRVLVLGAAGAAQRTIPAEGSLGAGIQWLLAPGDTLLLPDLVKREIVRATLDGQALPPIPIDLADGIPLAWRGRPDGRLIEHARWVPLPSSDEKAREFLRVRSPGGALTDTLFAMPALWAASLEPEGLTTFLLYEPKHVFGLLGDGGLLTAESTAYRVTIHSADGRPARVLTLPVAPEPLDEAARERLRDWVRVHYENRHFTGPAITRVLNGLRYAEHASVIADLHGGPGGTIWVQRAAGPAELTAAGRRFDPRLLGSRDWDVFDAEGRYLGPVRFPDGFRATAWDGDRVVGIIAGDAGDRLIELRVSGPMPAPRPGS